MIYEFKGFIPVIHESSFIHPQAAVTGNVIIGKNVYVGPGAAIRGDWGEIIIEDGCNVQENCTIHMFPGKSMILKEGAHIGHGAVIHGATIGKNCLVGMNSVIMDNVQLGDECIVGALSFIKEGDVFEPRSLIVGNPGKKIKEVTDEMMTNAKFRFPLNTPQNKEEYRYRTIFEEHFPSETAAATVPSVPSVACSTPIALEWDEAFKKMNDPSGRAVISVHEDSY